MSQLKTLCFIFFLFSLLCSAKAFAGVYGFDNVNPYTSEEEDFGSGFLPEKIVNYRHEMRKNIALLADYAKSRNSNFQIILHANHDLFSKHVHEENTEKYNKILQNSKKNPELTEVTSSEEISSLLKNIQGVSFINVLCEANETLNSVGNNITPILIEKCETKEQIDSAIQYSIDEKIPLYVFSNRDNAFNRIKKELIIKENSRNVFNLNDAKNISFLVDDSLFSDKAQMIRDVENSNYDIVVIKPLFHDKIRYSKDEIQSMKKKKNGGKRLIISEISLSEISPTKYSWKEEWNMEKPIWMKRNSFIEKDAFIVEYWHSDWRKALSSHFRSIMDIGFDGAWLTGAHNFQYFEKLTPLN